MLVAVLLPPPALLFVLLLERLLALLLVLLTRLVLLRLLLTRARSHLPVSWLSSLCWTEQPDTRPLPDEPSALEPTERFPLVLLRFALDLASSSRSSRLCFKIAAAISFLRRFKPAGALPGFLRLAREAALAAGPPAC